jgi:hypothetical protein
MGTGLSTTAQPCAVDAEARVAVKSTDCRARLRPWRKHAAAPIRLVQVALAAALGAALGGALDARAQSLFTEFPIPTTTTSYPTGMVK